MPIESLDPRISRLGIEYERDSFKPLQAMDQLETYEIFTQVREGKPYKHVGIMHAPNNTIAFIEGKEQYGRRGRCFGLWSVKTSDITLSQYAKVGENIFDLIEGSASNNGEDYDVFLQKKRGDQHEFLATVKANSPEDAFAAAKASSGEGKKGCNLWAAKTSNILKTDEEDKVIFETAPEKQFREALIYKIKDRITAYREKHNIE